MKQLVILTSLLLSAGLLAIRATPKISPTQVPAVVLELFTSEGCSSCPSADQLLAETIKKAATANQPVYALSFHVDYWNRLGWRDPFSDARFTRRQWQYAGHFGAKSVYTPQLVLNGQQEFVGSNRAKLNASLPEALKKGAPIGVQVSATPAGNTITVTYVLSGNLAGAVLNVALVSQHERSAVAGGENAGRQLVHSNVVRAFETVKAAPTGQVTLSVPPNFNKGNGAIIAYVQNAQTLLSLGASRVGL